MDNLVLIRVAATAARLLPDAIFQALWEGESRRFALSFDKNDRHTSWQLSLHQELPWIGRPTSGGPRKSIHGKDSFGSRCTRALRGLRVASVEKAASERSLTLRFADGSALVAELVPRAANLIYLAPGGTVVCCARTPHAAKQRLAADAIYEPRPRPPELADPFVLAPTEIDEILERGVARGQLLVEAMKRGLLGLGSQAPYLVAAECRLTGRSAGAVLAERLSGVVRCELDPLIEAEPDLLARADSGRLEARECRLYPWDPLEPAAAGLERFRLSDPSETAGFYHDAIERAGALRDRSQALHALLSRQIAHLRHVELQAQIDSKALGEPEKYKRWGEALLAGLSRAQRSGEQLLVADPYDPGGSLIAVPVPRGQRPQDAAVEMFRRHRRAVRGIEHAATRVRTVGDRQRRLEQLQQRFETPVSRQQLEGLEGEMQKEGIPVGLEPARSKARPVSLSARPRLEGVRLLRSSDGLSILVGKGGRENQRLTFKLAGPEDFWFHAHGVPGAHVVVRNDERHPRPPATTLMEAAAVAAWYSDARGQDSADVQWTRRKYVRKLRGAPAGTVKLKRFETIRVRPELPEGIVVQGR